MTTSDIIARPKIHRPPAFIVRKTRRLPEIPGFMVFWVSLFIVLAGGFVLSKKPAAEVQTQDIAKPEALWVIPDNKPAAPAEKNNNVIVLQGDKGGIIGQMARIPSGTEAIQETKITEVNASFIDKDAARELLSIVNKY